MALQIYSSPDLAAKLTLAGTEGLTQGLQKGLDTALEAYQRHKQSKDLAAQLRIALGGDPRGLLKTPPSSTSAGSGDPEADALQSAQDQVKNASKMTKALRTYGEHGLGYDKSVLDSMGTSQLMGLLQRETLRGAAEDRQLKLEQAQAQSALYQAHAKMYEAQAADRKREADNAAKFPSLMEELDKATEGSTKPITPGAMIKAYKASGYSPTGNDDNLIRSFKGLMPTEQKGLPIGSTFTAPDGTKYVGMGTSVQPRLATHQPPPEIDRSKYPWLFDSNQDRYLKGLATVSDPAEQDKIQQNRNFFVPVGVQTPAIINWTGIPTPDKEDPNKPPQFKTEEAARRAGHVKGDIILLWDQKSQSLRRYQLD